MNMTLYNYAGDTRKLNKYLSTIATVNIITITDETNILAPTVIIGARAFNFNYAYIPAFNRYYFVENVDIMRGERIAVRLRARSEIVKGRGTQFDPHVADLMIALIDADTNFTMRDHEEEM